MRILTTTWMIWTAFAGCDPSGEQSDGLMNAKPGGGPAVVWDVEAKPLPEIPLPNDSATRLDASSATGRRLNISEEASTALERRSRRQFNRLDGFGTYAPITVSFDAPLELTNIIERHKDTDFRNDAFFLLNVDEDCERFGEEVAMDIGGGRFPVTHMRRGDRQPNAEAPLGYALNHRGSFFRYDLQADSNNLLFSDRNEDINRNGIIDPGEDLDHDGVLDQPNFVDPAACDDVVAGSSEHDRCVADNLLTWYERESDTLILRPIWPLEAGCSYAVVLTDRLTGQDGRLIDSPFTAVNPRDQTSDLRPVLYMLGRYGLSIDNIRFAWSFTTGTVTADMEALRAGLYGEGVFSQLNEKFPVSDFEPWTRGRLAALDGQEADPAVADDVLLPGACVGNAMTWLWGQGMNEWAANMCAIEADQSTIADVFAGTFSAPDLLVDRDDMATDAYPSTVDEIWELDPVSGDITYGHTDVTFWCALPYERDTSCSAGNPEGTPFCKPYPVVMYGHGYGGSRAEVSLHMGRHTAMGYAACSLDYYGHGLNVWLQDPTASLAMSVAGLEFNKLGVPELKAVMTMGRDRDLDNDGLADSGADMWTADVFHTRDMVRQSTLESTQFVRILRSMDGETESSDGGLLGDLDGDGSIDLGGPENTIGAWGVSLGGIITGVLSGSEPGLNAVSPNAGGAGLGDIGSRSVQAGVPQAVILPILGPFVSGCMPADDNQHALPVGEPTEQDCHSGKGSFEGPYTGGQLRLAFILNDRAKVQYREFAQVEGVEVGDRLVLRNLNNGEEAVGRVDERGFFRMSVPSDALNSTDRRPLIGLEGDATGQGSAEDNTLLGDALELTVHVGDTDEVRAIVNAFEQEVIFQGTVYPADTTLVALQEGLGKKRNSPDLRRFMGIAQNALSWADPGVWSAHAFLEPLDVDYDPNVSGGNTRVLMMPTAGDSQVPTQTGVAMARTAGVLGSWLRDEDIGPEYGWREIFVPDERLGTTPDEYLVDTFVVEGDPRMARYGGHAEPAPGVLFDIDNVSDGLAEYTCGDSDWSAYIGENGCLDAYRGEDIFFTVPTPELGQELRWDRPRGDGTSDAIRVPLLRPIGQHGIYNSQSFRVFDNDSYMVNFTVRFLGSRGANTRHEPTCDCSASDLSTFTVSGEPSTPGLNAVCTEDDVKVCSEECADAWGLLPPPVAECTPAR